MTPGALATTAIGSLPHTDLAAAVAAAFRLDIPCLPALPHRAPTELLVPQGLFGLPGLVVDPAGNCTVDIAGWREQRIAFQKTLTRAIDDAGLASPVAFGRENCSAWELFLGELHERKTPLAKIQLLGPLTARRSAILSDGRPLGSDLGVANQVFQLLVARALTMIRAVQSCGARPLFFFDEPGLTGLSLGAARNLMGLQELRASVIALRRTGALVGLHCCGEALWERILPLGFNFLSVDVATSLSSLLRRQDELAAFSAVGGRLVLGIIPTNRPASGPEAAELLEERVRGFTSSGNLALLRTSLLTPACGLALQTIPETEATLEALREAQSALAHSPALA